MDQRTVSPNEPQSKREGSPTVTPPIAPPLQSPRVRWLRKYIAWLATVVVAVAIALYVWRHNQPTPIPPGIAMSNGRIEATEIDVATKLPGRIKEVLAQEGDFVEAGQVIARMDTQTLEAQLRQTEAQARQAGSAITTAEAVVAQRRSELAFAQREQRRSEDLVARGFISPQKLDSDRTRTSTAKAALAASQSQVIETRSTLEAATAAVERVRSDIEDSTLKAARAGRVQYRLAEPGEVLPAGGKVITLLDISDVYMTLFLPETLVGKIAIGAPARIILDAASQYVIPAKVSYVASEAQFTPKTVETTSERQKLAFRVKVQIDPELLRKYRAQVKTGLPGIAYVQFDANAAWPSTLQPRLPQ